MKVIALDIATQTGICVGKSSAEPTAWSVDLGKGLSQARRFSNVLKLTHGLIAKHSPDLIVCEAAIGGANASAYLIGLIACVKGCAANRNVRVEEVFPATVRKHFLGKALTSRHFPDLKPAHAKIAIKERVKAQAECYGWVIPDLDAADAAATWDWSCAEFAPGYVPSPTGGLFHG